MNVVRAGSALALMTCSVVALAYPAMVRDFNAACKVKPGGALEKAACAVCHVGTTHELNPYGHDLKKALKAADTKKLSLALLNKVAKLDSDKDGVKNAVEIKMDKLPGDPKSKPATKSAPRPRGKSPRK